MPTLHLLRHAKSSWEHPSLHDHDRPLAPRGVRACTLIADHLRERRITPDLVLCSTALRARRTLEGVAAGFSRTPRVHYEAAIYDATAPELIDLLRHLPAARLHISAPPAGNRDLGDPESVMLIGHQPGIGELATTLAASGDRLADLEAKFPTAALATLELDSDWRDPAPGSARLTAFVKPKELARTG
ncbi:MAG TPA: histidine phosphatase family protein [Solirubrobacterales bacterium]|nr:histidine phosphatase family protein [Solirubrobacterales bacterium]